MDMETTLDIPGAGPGTGKRMVVMILGILGLALLIGLVWIAAISARIRSQPKGEPPQTVTTTVAAYDTWQPGLSAVGTLRAVKGADLAFEVSGVVTRIGATPGGTVQQGQTLIQLDDSVEAAQLKQLQAALALARVNLARAREQLAIHAISQGDFDATQADFKVKEASAQQAAAVVAKKRLSAPFAGRVGIISTSPGAFINSGTSVVTLQQMAPIFADFYLPQRDASSLATGQTVELAFDAFPGQVFKGRVTVINPKVDGTTRNIQVEASLRNAGHRLLPGMFAGVTMQVGAREKRLTLPQTAITYNPYGATVFVVKQQGVAGPDGRNREALQAEQVFVTTGPTRGDQVAILKGLKPGDVVVTSGGLKLKNGTPLIVNNSLPPSNDPNPAPQEQ